MSHLASAQECAERFHKGFRLLDVRIVAGLGDHREPGTGNEAGIRLAIRGRHDAESQQMAATQAGKSDRSWVDATLKKLGCEIA